jgi:transposase
MASEQKASERERQLEEEIRRLKAENEAQKKRLSQQADKIRQLEIELARSRTTSHNSSKRPSSDIVKPRRERRSSARKIGGQAGHPQHERQPLGADEIDRVIAYHLTCCPDCHGALEASKSLLPNVLQQVELVQRPIETTEHRARWYWCAHCQKLHCPLPAEVERAGLCGPVLTACIAYLKGGCHASFSTIRKFLRDVLGVRVCRGLLAKVISKVSAALAEPWTELQMLLPLAKLLNIDETGHQENGQRMYTWCYRARHYILFKIAQTRGTAELLEMLGADFAGVIGCDFFSSYRCYMAEFGGVLQFCLAHFIREVKFLLDLPDRLTRQYGQGLLEALRGLFQIIHERWRYTATEFQWRLNAQRREILRVAAKAIPNNKYAQNLAARLKLHGESYFRFITTPGLEPTNNTVEQAIRFVVEDRHITQGTRSEKGQRWCERIWTVIATCAQQGRSAFHFIRDAVVAYFSDAPAPSLAPT